MKFTADPVPEPVYTPVKLELIFETQQELDYFTRFVGNTYDKDLKGSMPLFDFLKKLGGKCE